MPPKIDVSEVKISINDFLIQHLQTKHLTHHFLFFAI